MTIQRNIVIAGKHDKPILLDYGYSTSGSKKPVVLFAHGFKGFKDWGHFNRVMEYFINNGFAFVKFNFSHNGGTVEQPIDFPDLEAFGQNNYSKELDDLRTVVDWIENLKDPEMDAQQLYLIGHSRGGGISILAAHEDSRIKKLVTWAAVADFIKRLPADQMKNWEKEGVIYIANGRTHQQMPMYYQFAQDVLANKERLNIERAARNLKIPQLIIHGTADEAVGVEEAQLLKQWNPAAKLVMLEGAGHTFGAAHPYTLSEFPKHVQEVLVHTLDFFRN